ncbi:MAG TPA: AAA family ATPase [Solirubrobacterales bacterium]|nr:AAA family ATPase [Solirubrobacterales bacterium]
MLQERERELAKLAAALDGAGAGKGCAVAIEAGAGLGKTRLLNEVRESAAEAGFEVLTARATDLEREFPFALVRQLFGSPLATLAEAEREALFEGADGARSALGLGGDQESTLDSFAVLHGLYWVTAALAERKPLLLAIDDAHTADPTSLDYLTFLLPRLEELPVLVVVTARPEEPDAPDALDRVLGDSTVQSLTLAPLSAKASTALLAQELDRQPDQAFADACYEASGGNPFLLREVALTAVEQGIDPTIERAHEVRDLAPKRVGRMVLTRLARLSAEATALARSLAVLGDDSDPRLLADLTGLEMAAVQRAADELRTSAIAERGPSLRFIHPLVRNAIYADMTVGERADSHARAASLLRTRNASPERIATHLLACEARGEEAAAETLVAAAEWALATGAPRSAIAYLTRALAEPPPPDLRLKVLELLLASGFRAGDYTVGAAIEPEVRSEMERDRSLLKRWALPLTQCLALGGRFEDAASVLKDAAEVALADGDLERAFQLEAQLSTMALLVPSVQTVDLEPYLDQVDPDSPSGRLAAAMEVRSAGVSGVGDDAADAAERALGREGIIFAEEPDPIASMLTVPILVAADRMDEARLGAERALAIARERGALPGITVGLCLNGYVAWGFGDLLAAEADLNQAVEVSRLAGVAPTTLLYTTMLVEIRTERDELDAAEALLQSIGMATGPIPDSALFAMMGYTRGHLRFERGEFEQAIEDFRSVSPSVGLGYGPTTLIGAGSFTARALLSLGEQARARELVDGLMAPAQRWGSPTVVATALRTKAAVQGGAEGIALLEEAVAKQAEVPKRLFQARTLLDLGEALRREGHRAQAREPLREAFALTRQCGATRLAKRAHAELEATGETLRRYTPIGVESLTPSERRVAELAASGMTNRQIAQSLFVTVKTVEAHLSAAYDKLDISSRGQLPGVLGGDEAPAGGASSPSPN